MNELPANRQSHWEKIYQTKGDRETSWFQEEPQPSLNLVRAIAPPNGRVLDVGGGSSALGGLLAAQGFSVSVLDVSAAAIDRAKSRTGELADRVRWIVGDVTEVGELGTFDVWHDRAVFHFLTAVEDRRKYIDLATRSVAPGGHLIVGTFGVTGPEKCSGLPVERYDRSKLAATFGDGFKIVKSFEETHTTPWGKPQVFFFAVMRRAPEAPN